MTIAVLLLLRSLAPAVAPADTATFRPGVQVITAEDIERAGLVRPADLFRLIDGWTYESVNGFDVRAYAPGADPDAAYGWQVWIDGAPAGVDLLGVHDLNHLPLALHDVAYVEVFEGPRLAGGRPAPGGFLHVHTRRVDGWTARGGFWQGNETGDPGPLRYLGDDALNIDRLGGDATASAAWRRGAVSARVTGVSRHHFPTDPAIRRRHTAVVDTYPEVDLRAASADVRVDRGRAAHGLSVGRSALEHFLLLDAVGREVPVGTSAAFGTLQGTVPLGRRAVLRYRLGLSRNELGSRDGAGRPAPEWRADRAEAAAGVRRTLAFYEVQAGVRGERTRAVADGLDDGTLVRATLHGTLRRTSGRLRPEVTAYVTADGDGPRSGGIVRASWQKDGRLEMAASVAFVDQPPDATHPLLFWTRRGYGLLSANGHPPTFDGPLRAAREVRVDVEGWLSARRGPEVRARAFFRRLRQRSTTAPAFTYDPVEEAFSGPVHVTAAGDGAVVGTVVSVRHRPVPRVAQQLAVVVQDDVAGTPAFRGAWAGRPRLQLQGRWTFAPVSSFAMGAALRVQTASRAAAYGRRVPAFAAADAWVTKWLWHRRLRGDVIVRNMLDDRFRTHAVGATYDLALLVKVTAQLGG